VLPAAVRVEVVEISRPRAALAARVSFLDFLRDLALTGNRQIFFSTANEKLATLFERKFDFLGKDGFKRYDLRR
jgi:hypothetical protein